MPASESDARSPDGIFVCYDEWLAVYEKVKAFGEWGDVIAFLELHPATVNNQAVPSKLVAHGQSVCVCALSAQSFLLFVAFRFGIPQSPLVPDL